ncbi:MAG: hypothetical protein ACXWOV_15745 [Isosphaeraceae bacterium]|jgi:hypothetical protein
MAASNVATGQARAVLRKTFATRIHERESGIPTVTLLKDFILGSVEKFGESGQDHRYGFGRLDVLRAIDFALERGYGRFPKES